MGKIGYIKRGHYVRIPLSELNKFVSEGVRPANGEEKSA